MALTFYMSLFIKYHLCAQVIARTYLFLLYSAGRDLMIMIFYQPF